MSCFCRVKARTVVRKGGHWAVGKMVSIAVPPAHLVISVVGLAVHTWIFQESMCDVVIDVTWAGSTTCPCALNPQWSIRWDELEYLTFIAEGGFGKVYSATWRFCEVRVVMFTPDTFIQLLLALMYCNGCYGPSPCR